MVESLTDGFPNEYYWMDHVEHSWFTKLIIAVCPDGWEWNLGFSRCYYIIPYKSTWSKANELCKSYDPDGEARLIHIFSLLENVFIKSIAESYPYLWIGGSYNAEEGIWRWVTDFLRVLYWLSWYPATPTISFDPLTLFAT